MRDSAAPNTVRYTYTYDAEGNRTAKFIDENDNAVFDSGDTDVTEYSWDHRNRLTQVTSRNSYGGAATQFVNYVYDPFNQLIKRTVDSDGDGTSSAAIDQTFYLYDQGQVVLEFNKTGTGSVQASATSSMPICDGPSSPMEMPACEPTSLTLSAGNATDMRI